MHAVLTVFLPTFSRADINDIQSSCAYLINEFYSLDMLDGSKYRVLSIMRSWWQCQSLAAMTWMVVCPLIPYNI